MSASEGVEALRSAAQRLEQISAELADPETPDERAVELAREAAQIAADAGGAAADAARAVAEAGGEHR